MWTHLVREVIQTCLLVPALVRFIARSPWRLGGSSFLVGTIRLGHYSVLVAIFSSKFTINRLTLMENSILNHSLFDVHQLKVVVVLPQRHPPAPGKLPSAVTICPTDVQHGLCCRVDWAMRMFLKGNANWFLRAIDDSWFNPYNLKVLIQQLESFVNPHLHVVIKSHNSPVYNENWKVAFMQGGAPTLMSRAAVRHAIMTFLSVCRDKHWSTDDLALTLIANRSFRSAGAWGDVRFAGATSPNSKTEFRREWDLHKATRFQSFQKSCAIKAGS
jgi:hypothetical protein